MSDPEYRSVLIGSDRQEISGEKGGRVGVGSTYHCFHGKTMLPQMVLEWTPFESIVTRDSMGGPFKKATFIADYELEPIESGTRLRRTTGRIEVRESQPGSCRGSRTRCAPSSRGCSTISSRKSKPTGPGAAPARRSRS